MRKIEYILILISCLLLQACPASCDDKEVSVTVQNDTEEELFCAFCSIPPYASYNFFNISPYSKKMDGPFSMNDIKSQGLSLWIVRAKTVEKHGWDSVIKNQLYDSVLEYSWDELSSKNYVVKIYSINHEN